MKSLGTFDNERDAEGVLSAAAHQLATQDIFVSHSQSLGAWALTCLDRRELSRLRDVENDRSRFRCHIAKSWIAEMPLAAIKPSDVRTWLGELEQRRTSKRHSAKPLSTLTVRRCASLLSTFFRMAIDEGLIETNPAHGVRLPKHRSGDEPWTYLSQVEQVAIVECLEIPEPDRLRILFAIYTGVRQNEQWCMPLSDVHLEDEDNAHVVVRFGSPGRSPKNGKIRQVPLLPGAVAVVRRWLELLPSYAKRNPMRLLWPTPSGSRRQKSKTYGLKEHLAAAGIRRRVRWHDLRHTCASSLLSGIWGRPWRLEEVAAVLGHTSIQVTQRYAHLSTSIVQAAANDTPGLRHPKRAPVVHEPGLTQRLASRKSGATEPKVVRSNRTGRAKAQPAAGLCCVRSLRGNQSRSALLRWRESYRARRSPASGWLAGIAATSARLGEWRRSTTP